MSDEKHLRTFTFLTYGEVQDNGWISAHVWKQLSLSCVFLECFGTWIQPAIPKPKIKKRSYQCPSIVCYLMLLIPNGKSTCKDCRRHCHIRVSQGMQQSKKMWTHSWGEKGNGRTRSCWYCILSGWITHLFQWRLGQTTFLSLGRQETDTICTYMEGWSFNNVTA